MKEVHGSSFSNTTEDASNFCLYQKEELIGSGGFGQVYAGIKRADKKPVAIKIVKKKKVSETNFPKKLVFSIKCIIHAAWNELLDSKMERT